MAENRVIIEGGFPPGNPVNVTGTVTSTPTGTQTVAGTVGSVITTNPNFSGVYLFSSPNTAGVALANNFVTLYNPVGSGKNVILGGAVTSCITGAASNVTDAMTIFRFFGAPTGGVVQTPVKFKTSYPNPVAEVRTGNPTVTVDGPISMTPPALGTTIGLLHVAMVPAGFGEFTLAPGEGLVLRTLTGDTDQRWNLSQVWGEM